MVKHSLMAAALATAVALPAYAQTSATPSPATPASHATPAAAGPATAADAPAGFLRQQDTAEWRSSKLVGTSVYGPDNKSIGTIDDLIIDRKGGVEAAVIGVGGFLGVGQKDVAVPFSALTIQRKANSSSIDKITVTYTKQQLSQAPTFAYFQVKPAGTTTTGSTTPGAKSAPVSAAGAGK